jgi:SAM-dependent methyltransferase
MTNLETLKWLPARLAFTTVGPASEGIRRGLRYGFSSGEMLDYVYEDRPRGRWLVGGLIDRLFLGAAGWRGIRERRANLARTLTAVVLARRGAGLPTRILDVASGPGRYLLDVAGKVGRQGVELDCRDADPDALAQGRRLAAELGLGNVTYRRHDALDPEGLGAIRPRPDVAVVSGLYEIVLDDRAVEASLRALGELLAPGGLLVVTGQPRHPQLELIRNLLRHRDGSPWVMRPRPTGVIEAWCRAAGAVDVHTTSDSQGIFTITFGRKPAGVDLGR